MVGMALKRDGHDPALAVEIQMIDQPENPNTASTRGPAPQRRGNAASHKLISLRRDTPMAMSSGMTR